MSARGLVLAMALALVACEAPTAASSTALHAVGGPAVTVPTRPPEPVESREVER